MPTGTITTDGTEQTVFDGEPKDTVGEIEGSVDLSGLSSGDVLVVRLYKAVDGENDVVIEKEEFEDELDEPGVTFGFVGGDPENAPISLTVEQTSGDGVEISYEYQRIY